MRTAATLLISNSLVAALSASARADLITVVIDHELIVTNNDIRVVCFEPELTTSPIPGPSLRNSLRLAFTVFPSGTVESNIVGNTLPPFSSTPFQTPTLLADLGLNQLGSWIDSSRIWSLPTYDPRTGDLAEASIGQFGDDGEIDIRAIPDGGSGYVGYATSDLTMFGYMQIQRLSLTQWRLVGYRYDDSGAPVLVENLIPAPGVLATLGLFALTRARRRGSGATSSRHAS